MRPTLIKDSQSETIARSRSVSVGLAYALAVVYSDGLRADVRLQFDAYPERTWAQRTWALDAGASSDRPLLTVHKEDAGDGTVPAVNGTCQGLTLAKPAVWGGRVEHSGVYSNAFLQNTVLASVNMLLAVPPGTSVGR